MEVFMDASFTIRRPRLPRSEEKQEPTLAGRSIRGDQLAEASDEALMVQLGEGSPEALTVLFRRYARVVRSVASRAVRDGSEADDLVQDIFLLVYRDANAFDHEKGSART
jgi:hypothetical protein